MSEQRTPQAQDFLSPRSGPALNATTDAPVIDLQQAPAPEPEPEPEPQPEPQPSEPVGEPSATPPPAETEPQRRQRITEAEARRAAEKRADELANRLEQSLKIIEALTPKKVEPEPEPPAVVPPSPAADPRPRRADFDDPDLYEDAYFDWRDRRQAADLDRRFAAEREAREREVQQRAEEAQRNDLGARWHRNRQVAVEAHPDFAQVVEDPTLLINNPMLHAMMISDDLGPEIGYWLGTHRDEANRIIAASNVNPVTAYYEIGRIRQMLEAPVMEAVPPPSPPSPEPEPEPIPAPPPALPRSALPPPISPLEGVNGSAYERSPEEMSMEEYASRRFPQLMAERRASMWGNRQ